VKDVDTDMTSALAARMLALAQKAFGTARELLAMRGQYFTNIVQYGVEAARQKPFLVEQGNDAVHSLSHHSVRESLNQRLKSEPAKLTVKAHLDRATGGGGGGGGSGGTGSTRSGSSAGGAAADAWELEWKEMGRVGWLRDSPSREGRQADKWRDVGATE
jgi:uncharacterized membrane protein YgcG